MSSTPPEALFPKMKTGLMAERLLDFVAEFVEKQCEGVEDQVFKAIESEGGLDPQVAVQAWIQVYAVRSFPKKLRKQMRDGKVAAKKIAEADLA